MRQQVWNVLYRSTTIRSNNEENDETVGRFSPNINKNISFFNSKDKGLVRIKEIILRVM
jgi:hypothetical protein